MGQFGQIAVDDFIACIIRDEAHKANIPEHIAMGIAGAESGFDPNVEGDNGDSIGLFQLNTNGGQGSDYRNNRDALKNPRLNAQIAMPYIRDGYFWAINNGYTGWDIVRQTAIHSGHPGYVDPFDYRVNHIVEVTSQLIFNADVTWAVWPPFNAAGCAGVPPPPPPLDSWSEGPAPTNRDESESAIDRHAERIQQLCDMF